MIACVYFGSVPAAESCADAIKQPDQSRRECRAYKHQLVRSFPIPKGVPVKIVVRRLQHDWGNYCTVDAKYDDTNDVAMNFAFGLESKLPKHWDEQAVRELASVLA